MKFLHRSIQLLFIIVALFVGVGLIHAHSPEELPISIESQGVEYELPYAGLLPDHPLYTVKAARDAFWLFFTRDAFKKAELLLLFSDKKVVMAQSLADKGKWTLAIEALEASEKDVDRMIDALKLAQKIGSAPSQDFLDTALQSNEKHLEIMKNIYKHSQKTVHSRIEEVMQRNVDHYNQLDRM